MDQKSLIASMFYWVLASANEPISTPNLFGKEEKIDRLSIKNQIAYHFKKVVREVNQELFVSRRIDVSLLLTGIQVLMKTENEVRSLCNQLPDMKSNELDANGLMATTSKPVVGTTASPKQEPFVVIDDPFYTSFKEAKARCTALGMQLPEMYTETQVSQLMAFMKSKNIAQCFAGIEPDMSDSIARHISTQYPVWRTAFTSIFECDGKKPTEHFKRILFGISRITFLVNPIKLHQAFYITYWLLTTHRIQIY